MALSAGEAPSLTVRSLRAAVGFGNQLGVGDGGTEMARRRAKAVSPPETAAKRVDRALAVGDLSQRLAAAALAARDVDVGAIAVLGIARWPDCSRSVRYSPTSSSNSRMAAASTSAGAWPRVRWPVELGVIPPSTLCHRDLGNGRAVDHADASAGAADGSRRRPR